MTTTPAILHALANSPAQDGCGETRGRCWLCAGEASRGAPIDRWQGANFTDQNKARNPSATHVCEPCVWATAWNVPPGFPPPPPGKKGLNLRLFSHLYDERGYHAWNKTNKSEMLRWLREPKQGAWFAAISDTGQKHVIPWTPVNPGQRGIVRFEERNVSLPSDWSLVDDMIVLLTQGVTKDEISRGRYSVMSARNSGAMVRAFEAAHGRLRSSPWFDLALWLSQRDEEKLNEIKADRSAKRDAAKQARGGATRNEKRVPRKRSEPAQALGSDDGCAPSGGGPVGDRGADVHGDQPQAEPVGSKQLALF